MSECSPFVTNSGHFWWLRGVPQALRMRSAWCEPMAVALNYRTDAIATHAARLTKMRELLVPAGRPTRRDINVVLNLMLPTLLVMSFITGWIASLLGLSDFGLHKYSSFATFVVAAAHLGLHWRGLNAEILRLGSRRRRNPRLHASDRPAEHAARSASRPEDWIQAVIAQNGTCASKRVGSTTIHPRLARGGAVVTRALAATGAPSSSGENGRFGATSGLSQDSIA